MIYALLATLFTWGVTAVGAALVFFFRGVSRLIMDAMLGFSAGVMTAASFFSLLSPAGELAAGGSVAPFIVCVSGFMCGGLLLFAGDRIFLHYEKAKLLPGTQTGRSSFSRCLMLIISITLHNIPEGMAVGVAFASAAAGPGSTQFSEACLLALGIGLQNFPEGTAVSVPLMREGWSKKRSFFYGQLSGAVEPVGGLIGAALVLLISRLLPFLLSFAAGAMIYVVVEELVPESQSNKRKDFMALFTLLGFSVMMALDMALG